MFAGFEIVTCLIALVQGSLVKAQEFPAAVCTNPNPDIPLRPQWCILCCVLSVFCFLCTKLCHISSQKQLSKKITLLDFIPSSYLASPCWLSSITACTVWSPSLGDEVYLSSFTKQSKKQRRQPISFSAAMQKKSSWAEQHARQLLCRMNTF